MKVIETKSEPDGDQIKITVTMQFIVCECGMQFPPPLLTAGRYAIHCPLCNRSHTVSIEE